jgi:CubicO group peptidase (beta-lactamase class C family)
MRRRRIHPWLLILLIVGAIILAAIPSMWWYMGATVTILHPNAQKVPAVTARAEQSWKSAIAAAQQFVRSKVAERNLPGVSVAVGVGGELVWAEGIGYADLETKQVMNARHRLRLGTATTAITAAAAGLLLEQGKIDLDAEAQRYVPSFPRKNWPITLRHLMSHTSGLRDDGGDESPLYSMNCKAAEESFPAFADLTMRFEPGTDYWFSKFGWMLLSAILERVSGQTLETFLQGNVFAPAGMRETVVDAPKVQDAARYYFPRFMADTTYGYHDLRDTNVACYSGSMFLWTTPSDLVRFALAMEAGKIVRPQTLALLRSDQRLRSGKTTGYGLGWDLDTVALNGLSLPTVGHNGDVLGGMASSLLVIPTRGITVVVMSNIAYAGTDTLALRIAEEFDRVRP